MVKIALGAGHSLFTAGKETPDKEKEWSFNNQVVLAAIEKLNTYDDVQILRLDDPTGKTDVPLKTRTDKANDWNADVLVSIHHNSHTGKWGSHGGVETYTQPGSQKASKDIAAILQSRIVGAMGLRDRGLKTSNLHMTRESKMPGILTEGGFMDSTTDIVAMRDDAKLKAQGVAIADGLAKYFKLSAETTSEPVTVPKPPPTPSKPKNKTISQMASDVIASKHGSGHENRRKSLGISQSEYEKVRAEVNRRAGVSPAPSKPKGKTISQMAAEVIANKHGNGHDNRRKSLGINRSEYEKVRAEVNKQSGATPASKPKVGKTVSQMAQEVIDGKHGNGHGARRKSLAISQSEYDKVRSEVNKRTSGGVSTPSKTISQMATEVIRGEHGSGHTNRRKSLGISQAQYESVRAEVNKRL